MKISYWLALAFIFTIPWETVIESPILGSAARLVGLLLVAFWIVKVILTRRLRQPSLFHFVAYLYVLWNILSIFWSADFWKTYDRSSTFIQLLLFAYILWDLFTTPSALQSGLQAFILGAYVAVGSTFINYLSGETFYYERFSAASTNPDDLGGILALTIPVAWYLITSKDTTDRHPIFRVLNYAIIPVALLGIALSGTRSALLATIPGMIFGLAALSRVKFPISIVIPSFLIVASVALLPLVPPASLQRLGTIGVEISQGDLNGRTEIWQNGINSFEKHPLLGVGSNMFRSINNVVNSAGVGKVAHNTFLSVVVEVGLVGFGLFMGMVMIALLKALTLPKWTSLFWLSILATWSIVAFTLTWEYRKPTWLFLTLIVVCAAMGGVRDEVILPVGINPANPEAL